MNIPFNSNWKHVAISVSGGADSALLAYMVCQMATEQVTPITVHLINHIRCWKTKPWQQYDVSRVYNWLFQRFDHIEFVQHTNFIAPELEYGNTGPVLTDEYGKQVSGDNIQQRAFAEYVCKTNSIDAYYNGVTKNPPFQNFNGMIERDIELTTTNKHLEYMVHMGVVVSHPFRFIDKSWIIKQYTDLNIVDLLYITRSCEGMFDNLDHRSYTKGQYVPVCGKCFWCKEREWAIEKSK